MRAAYEPFGWTLAAEAKEAGLPILVGEFRRAFREEALTGNFLSGTSDKEPCFGDGCNGFPKVLSKALSTFLFVPFDTSDTPLGDGRETVEFKFAVVGLDKGWGDFDAAEDRCRA